jgi:hypothetical protein
MSPHKGKKPAEVAPLGSSSSFPAPLTVDDIEDDPSLIRDPNVRQKTKNRSGQKAGASKLHMEGPYVRRRLEMLGSPAFSVLSLAVDFRLDLTRDFH